MRNYLTTYDPFFDLFFPVEGETNRHHHNLMKTDIVEKKDSYLLKINVPGVKKEDIKISLLCDPYELRYARLSCPSLSPGVCSNSCPLSWWCYLTISSSAAPFSCCLVCMLV